MQVRTVLALALPACRELTVDFTSQPLAGPAVMSFSGRPVSA